MMYSKKNLQLFVSANKLKTDTALMEGLPFLTTTSRKPNGNKFIAVCIAIIFLTMNAFPTTVTTFHHAIYRTISSHIIIHYSSQSQLHHHHLQNRLHATKYIYHRLLDISSSLYLVVCDIYIYTHTSTIPTQITRNQIPPKSIRQ